MARLSPLIRTLESYPRLEKISDLDDPRVDRWRRIGLYQKARRQLGLFQVEGMRPVELLLSNEDFGIEALIVVSEELVLRQRALQERVTAIVRHVAELDIPIHDVTRDLFRRIANVKKLRGVMAIAHVGTWSIAQLIERVSSEGALALATVGLTDPGNLGTLIRTAYTFGGSALFALEGTTDPYLPKVIRASAGHVLPLATGAWGDFREACSRHEVTLLGLQTGEGTVPLDSVSESRKGAEVICIGSEGSGFPAHVRGFDRLVSIPMRPGAESLNAAVAGALVLWQRRRGV